MDQQINNSQPLDHSKLNPYHTFKMKPLQSMCIHVHQLKSSPQNYKTSPPTVEVASYAFKLFSKLEDNITKRANIFKLVVWITTHSSYSSVFIYQISYITVLSIGLQLTYTVTVNLFYTEFMYVF